MVPYSPHIYILELHESALYDAWEHEEIFNKDSGQKLASSPKTVRFEARMDIYRMPSVKHSPSRRQQTSPTREINPRTGWIQNRQSVPGNL